MRMAFVDLTKLIFAFFVCLYHFFNVVSPNPYFPLGDLTVELFILVAGVFLFSSAQRQLTKTGELNSPYAFLKKRFLRFFPYALAGYLVAFAAHLYMLGMQGKTISFGTVGNLLSDGIWEVLMIKMNGMNNDTPLLNVPAWTLSAMLICEFIAYSCMYNNKKLFETIIVPVTFIIGMGIWRHIPSAAHQLWLGYTTFGILRVWIIYCLSWYCYRLMQKVKEANWKLSGRAVLTVLEFLCYGLTIAIIMTQSSRNYRWVATLFLMVAVAISISGRSGSAKIPGGPKKLSWLVGEMSMGVYLTHYPIMRLFREWYPGESVIDEVLPFLGAVVAASLLYALLLAGGKKLFSAIGKGLKSWLTEKKAEQEA